MEETQLPPPQESLDTDWQALLRSAQERYADVKKLGEGGVGEVTLVQDQNIQRLVAMKTLKEVDDNTLLARFVEEAKTVGQLEHPNIVPIHDVGMTPDGQLYFTMKYMEGETLRSVITRLSEGDPLYHYTYNFERRTQIFLDILNAVAFAHSHGYIHRDIKPENIMIGPYGEVTLMDWGIAKRIPPPNAKEADEDEEEVSLPKMMPNDSRLFETRHGTLVGTPAYMSPEQVQGKVKNLDERSDIYSLTAVFYEFLCLRHYLNDHTKDTNSMLLGVLMHEPSNPEQLEHTHQGKVPRELCFFLRRGLRKKPKERYASVQAMIDELQANIDGRTCVYCPSTYLKRSFQNYGRFLDDHRYFGVALVAVLALFTTFGVIQATRWLLQLLA